MKYVKIIAALLAAVLLSGMLPAAVFAASPAITVSSVKCEPGGEAAVEVSISGNPGVCAGRLAISCGEYLELTGVEDGGLLDGAYFGSDKSANPYYVTWDDTLAEKDNTNNGTLVTLRFRVGKDAPSGPQPVTVSYLPGDFVNVSLQRVSFTVTNGTVRVVGGEKFSFDDVDPGAYYAEAVDWAVEKGITAGTGATTFSPEDGCTRGQVVTFLWRTEGEPEPAGSANPFRDVKPGDYFYKAVLWAVEKGITKGTSKTAFSPDDVCTIGQIVTFLHRWKGEPKPAGSVNPFRDVKTADYYFEPVLWAVEKGVTTGTDKTHFSPGDDCTRGQIVTFLKRSADADAADADKTASDLTVLREGSALELLGGSSDPSGMSAVDQLVEGMRGFAPRIDVSKYGLDEDGLQWVFQEIINTVPDLFYIDVEYRYTYDPSTGKIVEFIPTYTITDTKRIAEMKAEYEARIDGICSLVGESWSDLEIALFVHDYIVTEFEYDTSYRIRDVYNFFKEGRGVCQAYTLLYIEVLKRFGIEADAVISTSMNHTWNRVKLGGKWYHVDVTWDDPVPDQLGYAIHTYFLVSDAFLSSTAEGQRPHYGWKGYGDDIACTDRSYESAIWNGVATPFIPLGGSWFFIGKDASGYAIMKTADLVRSTAVKPLSERWAADVPNAFWVGYYSGLCSFSGLLVYNTPREIVSFDPGTGASDSLFRLPDGGHDLYGVKARGGIFYAVQSAPVKAADYIAAIPHAERYDADADGYIAMRDLAFLKRYLRGDAIIVDLIGADADANGSVDEYDVPAMKARLVGN